MKNADLERNLVPSRIPARLTRTVPEVVPLRPPAAYPNARRESHLRRSGSSAAADLYECATRASHCESPMPSPGAEVVKLTANREDVPGGVHVDGHGPACGASCEAYTKDRSGSLRRRPRGDLQSCALWGCLRSLRKLPRRCRRRCPKVGHCRYHRMELVGMVKWGMGNEEK
jgi:hypothetical protein